MLNFNLGSLGDWYEVGNGEALAFPVPHAGTRGVDFEVMSDDVVSIVAQNAQGDCFLVGVGVGHMAVKFRVQEDVAVVFTGPDGVTIFVKTRAQTQVLPETGEASFTNIEPRRMSATDKATRIHLKMQDNVNRRMAALLKAAEEQTLVLQQRMQELPLVEPAAAPPAAPAQGGGDAG